MKSKPTTQISEDLKPVMAVGTFVVDYHKVINHYPNQRGSAAVSKELLSNGGAPLNTLVNLAKLKVDFPLFAAARVGTDLDGQFIIDLCKEHRIDVSQITVVKGATTGYTDVFTVESSSQSTCFHSSSIGDTFSRRDVKLRAVKPKILFLGSLGALGKLDEYDADFGRKGATQLIKDANKQKITTIVELCPINRKTSIEQYRETLGVADYLIINFRLIKEMFDLDLYTEGFLDQEMARKTAEMLLGLGLRKAILIHAHTSAVYLDRDGLFLVETCALLPAEKRVGTAGIDHAFAAGFIEGLYHNKSIKTCLKQCLAVATACRTDLTPSGGIVPLAEL